MDSMQWKEFRVHLRYLSSHDLVRVEKALAMCKEVHKDQKRRSGDPYHTHPIAVALLLANMHADADTLIAALLHDAVEDTPTTLDDVDREFNGSVRMLIDGVTKLCAEDVMSSPTLNESVETLRKIFTLMEQDIRIMVIKLVDRLHNMQTAEFLPEEKRQILARETMDIYVKIADRLSMQDIRDELEGLCLAILDPERFADLQKLLLDNDTIGKDLAMQMQRSLSSLEKSWAHAIVTFENPSWDRLERQRAFGQAAISGSAPYAISIVAEDTDACYAVMGGLHQLWQREIMSFQDYINSPTLNGYRGLHTTVILKNGTRVRCKIRDKEMQEYAHRGIAMYCFDQRSKGVLGYLPWLKHIAPLSDDTRDRSKDFWQSLQSDLLEETTSVHGPGDLTVQVPKNATVLDAVFYLFQDEALKTSSIILNGKEVAFHTPIIPAASIGIQTGEDPTVTRQWLDWTNTGLATAKIRSALGVRSQEEKILLGKGLLQEILTAKRRGFIEEFSSESVLKGILSLGYRSLEDTYIAIADGRMDAADVYQAIFDPGTSGTHVVIAEHDVRFSFELGNLEISSDLIRIFQRYKELFRKLRVRYNPFTGMATVFVRLNATKPKLASFLEELQKAEATNISILYNQTLIIGMSLAAVALLLLWGFDPVVAHLLLQDPRLSPIDLTLVRFWSLTLISGLLILKQRHRMSVPLVWLTIKSRSLWASIVSMICIAIFTYLSLQNTHPLHYTIPMTSAGLLLTSIVHREQIFRLLFTWSMLLIGCALLIMGTPGWSMWSIMMTFAAVISFCAFSVVSEEYKRTQVIEARAAQYFFLLCAFCTLLTLPLLAWSSLSDLDSKTILQAVVFSGLFVGTPYYIYYYLLSHRQLDFVLRYSFLIIFATGFGQILSEKWNSVSPTTIAAGLIVVMGAIIPMLLQWKRNIMT